ncbi:MAG: hypothetical protein NC041_02310 [Bacteroides sp.]|nr:hypothetical protein [Prevotella sp.]MCM1407564.1 hypothetical protein [Treponema brennaborense]MCM1469286.1 hypothetical protein [Bacteroides sp.]
MKKFFLLTVMIHAAVLLSAEISPAPRRYFEIGTDIFGGFSNNYFSFSDILTETIELDFNKMSETLKSNGLMIDSVFDAGVFMNLNLPVFRLNAFAGVAGNFLFTVPQSLFDIIANGIEFDDEISGSADISADVFFQAGLGFSAKVGKVRFKVTPALFVPLIHISDSAWTYSLKYGRDSVFAETAFSAALYSSVDENMDMAEFFSSYGIDVAVGAEMPVFPWLDAGVAVENIPISSAKLNYRHTAESSYSWKTDKSIFDTITGDDDTDAAEESDSSSSEVKSVEEALCRQLRLVLTAAFRPFNNRDLFAVTASAAFKFNSGSALTMNSSNAAMPDFLVKVDFRPIKLFALQAATSYRDKIWMMQGGLMLNFRVFEMDLALATRSGSLRGCFTGTGIQAGIGIRLGF